MDSGITGLMGIFTRIYQKVLAWSHHQHAPYYLAGVSFVESSLFPVPPDVMLVSMSLAKPTRSWTYALVATIGSVIGGLLGYLWGYLFMDVLQPYLEFWGYGEALSHIGQWFKDWGVWVVLVAGFVPVPYKLFTIGAGAMHLAILPFFIASVFGRALRFYCVALAMVWGGEKIQRMLDRYVEMLGWLLVAAIVFLYCVYWSYRHLM